MRKFKRLSLLLPLLLCLLLCAAGPSEETALCENLSARRNILLFAPVDDTHLFAYTDDTKSHILRTDGSAACTTNSTTPPKAKLNARKNRPCLTEFRSHPNATRTITPALTI